MTDISARVAREQKRAKWILFGALAYCLLLDLLYLIFPESGLIYYCRPFSQMNALTAVYPSLHYIMPLFSVLPMAGWLLLRKDIRIGRSLILVPYLLAWVTAGTFIFFHSMYALRAYDFGLTHSIMLEIIPFLPFGIGVPVLVHYWKPSKS